MKNGNNCKTSILFFDIKAQSITSLLELQCFMDDLFRLVLLQTKDDEFVDCSSINNVTSAVLLSVELPSVPSGFVPYF